MIKDEKSQCYFIRLSSETELRRGPKTAAGNGPASTRRNNPPVQSSQSDDSKGGDSRFKGSKNIVSVSRKPGIAIMSPSLVMHRVTPITKGSTICDRTSLPLISHVLDT